MQSLELGGVETLVRLYSREYSSRDTTTSFSPRVIRLASALSRHKIAPGRLIIRKE